MSQANRLLPETIPPALCRLSPQESRVLECRRRGLSYKEAAAEMKCSVHTVKSYVYRVLRKLRARSSTEAIFIQYRQELVGFEVPIKIIKPRRG
jgi:DNA-binding NarL/FixJ family response regulator